VGGQHAEGRSLPAPYTKLEVGGTKYRELEGENWGGHDPNTGQKSKELAIQDWCVCVMWIHLLNGNIISFSPGGGDGKEE
jgi:hypothetical protein